MNNDVFFYSNKCKYCKQLIEILSDNDIIENYNLICIDNNTEKYPYIQRVPTLLVDDVKKPLVGVNAFNWINAKTQFNKNTNNINLNPNKNLDKKNNPLLFDNNNNKLHTKKDYTFINDNETYNIEKYYDNKIFTLPDNEKINYNVQKQKLNNLMLQRTKQDTNIFNDTNTKMSTNNDSQNTSKFNQINKKMNEINFSVPLQNDYKTTTKAQFLGKQTSKLVIDKNNLNV
jgi:hypothetical protein